MVALLKPFKTNQPEPEISTEQAIVASLSKDIIELRKVLDDQRKENIHFVYWIIGSIVAIVAVVAVEIMLFHTRADKDFVDLQNQYFQEIKEMRDKQFEMELRLQREIDSFRNPIIQELPKE